MSFIPTSSPIHSNREYNGKADRLKLPPISAMDELLPTRTWAPPIEPSTTYQASLPTPQPEQWKSPPYNCKAELARDTATIYSQQQQQQHEHHNRIPSPRYSNTSPIMHHPYAIPNRLSQSPKDKSYSSPYMYRAEQDIEEVVQQCDKLCKNMLQRRGEILHSSTSSFQDRTSQPWLDDMIGRANEVLNALLRLRKHQLATKNRQYNDRLIEEPYRSDALSDIHSDSWSSPNSRQRKRGKRATFQGRCHSCNISETPEWRRGPDGARTLCNACGLHYAKLARKQQQNSLSKSDLESLNSEEMYVTRKLTPPVDDIILNKSPTG